MMTTATTQPQNQNLTLQLRRVIRGSRQKVFEAWTKPELLQKWIGSNDVTVTSVTNDFRVEGKYHIVFEGDCESGSSSEAKGKTNVSYGVYTEIVPNRRLGFTWRGDWGPMEDTHVSIEFNDAPGGGTEIVLTHTRFANQEVLVGHNKGWTDSFNKLEKLVSA